jgi:hypothetical protein
MPQRVQLSRKRGWTMPPNTVKTDRSTGFGNPYRVWKAKPLDAKPLEKPWWVESELHVWMFATKDEATAAAIRLFTETMTDHMKDKVRQSLKGKNLACWCRTGAPCHADVLLEIANQKNT